MKKFMKKLLYTILVWGKPLIRKRIQEVLLPKLNKELKKKKIPTKVIESIETIIKEYSKKYI